MRLAAIALAAMVTPAVAEPYYDGYSSSPEKDPWTSARFEGGLGALVGSQRVGYIAGTSGGMHLDLGLKLDRL